MIDEKILCDVDNEGHEYVVGNEMINLRSHVVVTCRKCPYHWVVGKRAPWWRRYKFVRR